MHAQDTAAGQLNEQVVIDATRAAPQAQLRARGDRQPRGAAIPGDPGPGPAGRRRPDLRRDKQAAGLDLPPGFLSLSRISQTMA